MTHSVYPRCAIGMSKSMDPGCDLSFVVKAGSFTRSISRTDVWRISSDKAKISPAMNYFNTWMTQVGLKPSISPM